MKNCAIDMLPKADWPVASRFLHSLAEGGGDRAAVREGEAEIAMGQFVPHADLKRELDL